MTTGAQKLAIVVAATAVSLALAGANPPGISPADDDEEARFLGRQAFVDNCLFCHGEDMSTRQRLTAKQWSAEVEKMIGWGAPVPAERKAGLIAYLATSFSEKDPPPPPDLASADELLLAEATSAPAPAKGDAARGGPLYVQHCATCHGTAGQGGDLGPRLVERTVLLREDAYRAVVRKGLRRMPGFVAVLKPEAEDDLLAWLRSRRGD